LEDEAAALVPPPPLLHVHAEGSCVPPVATAAIDATTATPRIREQTNSVRVGCQSRLPEAGCLNLRMCLTPSLSSLRIAPGRSGRPVLSGARASLRASGVGGAVVGRLPSSVSAALEATAFGSLALRFETRSRGCRLRLPNGTGS